MTAGRPSTKVIENNRTLRETSVISIPSLFLFHPLLDKFIQMTHRAGSIFRHSLKFWFGMIAYWMRRYNKASFKRETLNFHTKMIIDINLFPRDVNKKLRKSKRWKLIENECLLRKTSGSFCGIHEIVSSYQIDTTRYFHDTRTKIMIIQSKREIKV